MNVLFELTLRGSLAAGVVWLLDRVLAGRMAAGDRRVWWALVPLAFLVAIPLPVLPGALPISTAVSPALGEAGRLLSAQDALVPSLPLTGLFFGLWLAGAFVYLGAVVIQTRAALRRWSGLRLSTDSAVLDLLEDAKAQRRVTAPIGLIVSDCISAPAIMGWLRPRILLPESVVATLTREQLRGVLLHELAHFRALDVPLGWLFTVARAVHWFNPAVHLAGQAWARFREEAADEAALRSLGGESPAAYGETLLKALRPPCGPAVPFGALAIGESVHQLKRRLIMINRYSRRSSRPVLAGVAFVLLAGAALLHPVRADSGDGKTAAVAAMQAWLEKMDAGQYDQTWQDASPLFQKAVTSAKWTEMSNAVRTPLGKCSARKLVSALETSEAPSPTGPVKGDFVVAQFDASFENLAYAVETVSFEKTPDGTWKSDGYYIKPKM